MPLTYRKTAKGLSEIETRAYRLAPRLRSALIVVDGKRTLRELRPLILELDETLATLADHGFIEPVPEAAPPPPPPPPLPPPPAAPAPVRPAAAADAPEDFEQTRRAAVRALNELLGPAAESLAIKMEKARYLEELTPLLAQAAQAVANMRGRGAAEAYAKRFGLL
jgi:hypothetical protein